MPDDVWINLPVHDLDRARAFYADIGFALNPGMGNTAQSACFLVGSKQLVLMLFPEAQFTAFARYAVSDTAAGSEMLISIGASSRREVDELADRVRAAGGTVWGEPSDVQGWMYGCGFSDVDGHRWNALYMDMSAMPKPG